MSTPSPNPPRHDSWTRRAVHFLRERVWLLLVFGFVASTAILLQAEFNLPAILYGLALLALALAMHRLRRNSRILRESQAQTQAILDTATVGILTIDHKGKLLSFNAAATRLFGRPVSEVIGQQISLLIPALDEGLWASKPGRWGETGLGGRREIEGLRSNGTTFPLDLSVSIGEVNQRRTFTIIARDLTKIKRAEEALHFERNLLARLMDHVPDRIYFKDEQSRFLRVNRALADQFGLGDPLEAIGKSDFDFFTPEHADPAFRDEQEVMRTGKPLIGAEEKETWRDGRTGWASTTKLPLRDKDGHIVGTFGVSRDITARKLAEVELRKAKDEAESNAAWARLVVDTAFDAFVVMDEQGLIVDWNRQAEAIFGWSREEALGRNLAETFVPPEFREAHHRGLARFLATGEGPVLDQRLELVAVDHQGKRFPVELTIRPIRRGDHFVFSAFLHDITERKTAQEELHKAKESAESANKAKSEFLANMSHEIRTPMNGILGMTELALNTELSAEQREYLDMVKSSAESLLTILNDILDFSKIEARKLHLEPVPFHLRDAVGDTVRALGVRAQQKGLELACRVHADVPDYVVGDPGRLRQVLVNLIGNALKFTSSGEVIVAVQRAKDEGQRTQLESDRAEATLSFTVRDTGIGIPAAKLDRIFQPFEQADHSTTRRYGGTGLGLAISTQLIELMGGTIRVSSEEGRGSTFEFTVHLGIAPRGHEKPPPQPVYLTGLKVLAVDDNATNRRIVEEILAGWAMSPVLCASADEAFAELCRASASGEPYPLVLLDAHMPDVDGFMLAARVQQTPALAGTVLVMLTSSGRPEDVARCQQLGIEAYLLKPIKQSDLLATLLTALDRSRRLVVPRESSPLPPATRVFRVLLAEDNAVNQKLATRLLEKQGHVVMVANNGKVALELLQRESFDAILMDVQMPEMDGFEATAAVRALEAGTGRRMPIVAMTAHAMKGDRERCLEAGMDGYVSKPIQARELMEAIEQVLAKQGSGFPA